MMRKNNNIKMLCLLGSVFVLTSCLPKEGEKIYPYNYDPHDGYYLTKDEASISPEMRARGEEGNMAPSTGMVFTPLFNKPVSTEQERFDRLEQAVQVLRNDVDVLIPRMFQVAAHQYNIEKKTAEPAKAPEPPISLKKGEVALPTAAPKGIVHEEKAIVKTADKTAAPVVAAAKAATPAPVAVAPTAPVAADSNIASVYSLRVADHDGITRIVLDLNSSMQPKVTVSEDGKHVNVDVTNLKWLPKAEWNALSGKLISGYKYANNALGVDLMYPAKISRQSLLHPNKDSKYYRLVVDLVSEHARAK